MTKRGRLESMLAEAESHAAKFARAAAMAADQSLQRHAMKYAESWQREAARNRAALARLV